MPLTLKGTVTQIRRCSFPVYWTSMRLNNTDNPPHPLPHPRLFFFATQGVPILFLSALGASATARVAPSDTAKRDEMHRCRRLPQLISSRATHSSRRKWANEAEVNTGAFFLLANWAEQTERSEEIFRSVPAFLNAFSSSYKGYEGFPGDIPWEFAHFVIQRIHKGPKHCTWIPRQWTGHVGPLLRFRAIYLEGESPHLFTIWFRMCDKMLDTLSVTLWDFRRGKLHENFYGESSLWNNLLLFTRKFARPLEADLVSFEGQRNVAIRIHTSNWMEEATKALPWPPLPVLRWHTAPPLTRGVTSWHQIT